MNNIDYYALGKSYEEKGEYAESYKYYEKYALNTKEEGTHAILLRLLLLRDGFTYSENLEKELLRSYGEYDLGLRNERLYEAIAEYLVFKNENKEEKAEAKKAQIKSIYNYGRLPILDLIIRKDSFKNSLNVPSEVENFINSL